MSAGSVPTNATEIYQEGLRIPPLKLREARRLQRHAGRACCGRTCASPTPSWATSTRRSPPARSARGASPSWPSAMAHNQLAAIFDELLLRSETHDPQGARAPSRRAPTATSTISTMTASISTSRSASRSPSTVKDGGDHVRFRRAPAPQVRGPAQLRAVGLAGGGVLCGARADRLRASRPTAAASGRSACKLPQGHDRQSARSPRRSTRAPRPSSASPAA